MILDLEDLGQLVQKLKQRNLKVVLCHGVFDLVHFGHLRHFEAAKAEGDILVVTVTPDRFVNRGPHRPAFPEAVRAKMIDALKIIDYVAINRWPTAVETIKILKPDIYCKGSEYDREADITGAISLEEEAIKEVGGRIYFTNEASFSSTELINRYFNPYPEEARAFLEKLRQKYTAKEVIKRLEELKQLKVLVVGENISDKYVYVTPLAKSPKENLIPMRYEREESFNGGGLVIANQVKEFCDTVAYRQPKPAVKKVRYIDPTSFSKVFEYQMLPQKIRLQLAKDAIKRFDLVIVCDYGHGLFDDRLKEKISRANFLALNVQTNSANLGFNLITKYDKANFFCVDEPELRLAYHDRETELKVLAGQLARHLGCNKGVITLGHKGSTVYSDGELYGIPALSNKVADRLGTGDAYFALSSLCACSDFPAELVGFAASAIAAMKVATIGNRVVERVALFKFIQALLK